MTARRFYMGARLADTPGHVPCPLCGGSVDVTRLLQHAERRHGVRLPPTAAWDCIECLRGWIANSAPVHPGRHVPLP